MAGRFADRPYIYVLLDATAPVPLFGRPVYFVLAASVGIEAPAAQTAAAARAALVAPGARLVAQQAGIEVIYWVPPPGQRQLDAVP